MSLMSKKFALSITALAAALSLAACDKDARVPTARSDSATQSTASNAPNAGTDANANTGAGTVNGSGTTTSSTDSTSTSGTSPNASTGPLAGADEQFVKKAAEGGLFEVQFGKLVADKASDPQVKSFAQMLVDDHSAANDKLKQIASSHNLTLPDSLPKDKQKELDRLSKLSGAQLDREVKSASVSDHKHDISDFEKESKSGKASDVKDFASQTLPTLQKHLAAAQKLGTRGKS